jgi:dTDP-4-amino-4,6-dideoxygalactose transaminase
VIECAFPKAQYDAAKTEIDAAIARVLERGRYILGDEVRAFQDEFAAYCGVKHGVGVASGTDAIVVALRVLGVGPGDEVVTVSHTAVATVAAIEMCGAMPVFVDIDPRTYTLDPARLADRLTARTKAIIAVHLYGHPAPLAEIQKVAGGIPIIEDCAQAHGAMIGDARVGSIGAFGCFSFYPTKNLGGLGDGGMVVMNDVDLAQRAKEIREYGWRWRYVSATTGINSRLDELQAAVLRVKLRTLDRDTDRRRAIAARYTEAFAGTPFVLPTAAANVRHVYHLYVVRTPNRDALTKRAREAGVGTLVHYPMPVHLQPAYVGRCGGADTLPESERAAREVLSLPMYPELTDAEVETVISTLKTLLQSS